MTQVMPFPVLYPLVYIHQGNDRNDQIGNRHGIPYALNAYYSVNSKSL